MRAEFGDVRAVVQSDFGRRIIRVLGSRIVDIFGPARRRDANRTGILQDVVKLAQSVRQGIQRACQAPGGLATQDDTTKFIGALTIVLSIGWSIMKALIAKRAKVAAVASPVGHATRMFPLLLCTVHYCPVKLLLTTRSAL